MTNSGIEDILSYPFGGVEKMFSEKKFPQNFCFVNGRGRIARSYIGDIYTADEFENFLSGVSIESRTAKEWVYCSVQPVLLIMLYVQNEQKVIGLFIFIKCQRCYHTSFCWSPTLC